jgi:cytochrome bd-type quinol oxidase subunit 1
VVLVGQPDTDRQQLDNPIHIPGALSFLTHRRWESVVQGLNEFPRDLWPDNIALLYYKYSLTVEGSKTGAYSLQVGLIWWSLGMVLATGYFIFLYHSFRGKLPRPGNLPGPHGPG